MPNPDPRKNPGLGIEETVPLIRHMLSSGPKTMLQLRRALPDVTTSSIYRGVSVLRRDGKIEDDGMYPKTYRVIL